VRLNPKAFVACFTAWMSSLIGSCEGKLVALDGKTLRRSFDRAKGKGPLHLVHAWVAEYRVLLGQYATEEKSNEITAIPELLDLLDLRGAVVTLDAMGCQKKIVAKIIEKEADRRTLMGATGAQRDPAAATLGLCASSEAAQWMVAQLESTADPAHVAALGSELAESASSWAHPGARSVLDAPLRTRAARALVRRWRELSARRDALGVAVLSMGGADVLAAVREALHDAPAEARPGLTRLERALVRDLGR
jgi:hypothetical protein